MAKNKTKRLRPAVLQADIEAFAAWQAIAGYNPANAAYEVAKGATAKTAMETKQTDEVQKQTASDAARDDAIASEWDFHDFMLGVKDQVKAQFGPDSNEIQSLGMKKKSDYKSGGRTSASKSNAGTP